MYETLLVLRTTRRSLLAGGAAAVIAARSFDTLAQQESPAWSDELDGDIDKLNVATTVAPISSIVRNIGGNRILLRGIVPDGTNSHTFEPAPSDVKTLAAADLVIANGLDLEIPTIELAAANLKEGAEIYTLGDNTISAEEYQYDFSFPAEAGHPNPHLWPNVAFAIRYAELVADKLQERDPANADYYAANLDAYRTELQRLDEGIATAVLTVPEQNRKLLTYHDSWTYFAERYGLEVIGAVQPSDFSEPSARDMARIIDQIRAENVPAIFGSEVFDSVVLEQIAAETDAVYVDGLRDDDPPGEPGDPEHTYLGMMLRNMQLMIPALGGSVDALETIEPFDTWSE